MKVDREEMDATYFEKIIFMKIWPPITILLCLCYIIGINGLIPTKFVFSEEHNNLVVTEDPFFFRSNRKLAGDDLKFYICLFNENLILKKSEIENILGSINQPKLNDNQFGESHWENQTETSAFISVFQVLLDNRPGDKNKKKFSVGIAFPFQYIDDWTLEPDSSIFSGLKLSDQTLHRKYLDSNYKTGDITLYINFEVKY